MRTATFYYVAAVGDYWFYRRPGIWARSMITGLSNGSTDRVVRTKAHADRVARHLLSLGASEAWILRRVVNLRRCKCISEKAWEVKRR